MSSEIGSEDTTITPRRRAPLAAAVMAAAMAVAAVAGVAGLGADPTTAAPTAAASAAVAAPAEADSTARRHTPFDGLSEEEVDRLSDDEYFDRIDRWLEQEAESSEDDRTGDDWSEDGWTDDGWTGDDWSEDGWTDDDWTDDDWSEDDWTGDDWTDEDPDGGDQDDDRDPDGADPDHGGEEPEPLATVTVTGDRIDTSDLSPEVTRDANAIWSRFAELIPADQRRMVERFELFPASYDGAHVYPSDQDPTKWTLGVAKGLGDDLDYVLIHEFGHLLTLNAQQVPPTTDGDGSDCATFFTGEGCALSGSTIDRFVARFWPAEMLAELERAQASDDYEGLDAFYDKHKDRFVTDYATTNPGEDIAETFAVFVTKDRPATDGQETVADQKVQFLWDDPAMVDLRAQIRANL